MTDATQIDVGPAAEAAHWRDMYERLAAVRSGPPESVEQSGDDVDELIDRMSLGGPNEVVAREALHRIRLKIERALFGEPNREFPTPSQEHQTT